MSIAMDWITYLIIEPLHASTSRLIEPTPHPPPPQIMPASPRIISGQASGRHGDKLVASSKAIRLDPLK